MTPNGLIEIGPRLNSSWIMGRWRRQPPKSANRSTARGRADTVHSERRG